MSYIPKAERARRRAAAQARGMGNNNKTRDKSSFWAGVLMGAATATGGFFAIKALERAFGKKKEEEAAARAALGGATASALFNPADPEDARARLLAAATGNPAPALNAKPPVQKRTIIEEMVEELG